MISKSMTDKFIRVSLICLIAVSCILLNSCKKGSFDLFEDPSKGALPIIDLLSASVDKYDVTITANVKSEGKAPVDYMGFFYSLDNPMPDAKSSQVLMNGQKGMFIETIYDLEPDTVYYFRAFACNDYGYVYSKQVVKVRTSRVVAPCSYTQNTIINHTGTHTFDEFDMSTHEGFDYWEVALNDYFTGWNYYFKFNRIPLTTGEYQVVNDVTGWTQRSVEVYFVSNMLQTWSIDEGTKVYVTKNSDGSLKIEFCNLQYTNNSGKASFKGHVLVKP